MFDILPYWKRVEVKAVIFGSHAGKVNIKAELEAQKEHTLKQVIEWGGEKCPHYSSDVKQPTLRLYYRQDALKKDCSKCWQSLQKEAEK
ncbi:hypothetical protein LCGC14_2310170 [marine sediment metagenome]|uniref:Uncharacterized protein n=1 Tax=marine sediment metagenome TaxID=412755 RepID=A0A0F9EYA0_9ZZZZ